MKWFLVVLFVNFVASAPLRLLRIRNMTFLFVETPDGERVDILYAPTGKSLGSLPIGNVLGAGPAARDQSEGAVPQDEVPSVPEEEYDPDLDGPRVEPSVIQAPRTKSGCNNGHRKDRLGRCRLIW